MISAMILRRRRRGVAADATRQDGEEDAARWRAGAKAQIALALILSYTCTSEVFRQLQAERRRS